MAANNQANQVLPLTRLEIYEGVDVSPFSPQFDITVRDFILAHYNLTVADLTPTSNADLRMKISSFRKRLREKLKDNAHKKQLVIDKFQTTYFDINDLF